MRTLSKTMLAVLATGLTFGLFCQQARAVGSISFMGTANASADSTPNTITFISFRNPGWQTLAGGTGDYLGIPGGVGSTFFSGFSFFGDGTGAILTAPVTNEWSLFYGGNTFTFDLLSLTSGTVIAGSINLTGTGQAYKNGIPIIHSRPATTSTWTLRGSGSNFTFTVSSIPEGGSSVALLGIALAGIEVLRRKINAKAA